MFYAQFHCRTQSRPHPMKFVSNSVDHLAEIIIRHVTLCPNACDTADGIRDWWIPREQYLIPKGEVLAALELLKARGQIESRKGADGQVLYYARGFSANLLKG
jgi:hypothetical protein